MSFGEVLTKAWQIIWKFKVLWIFGILAGCAQSINNGNPGIRYTFGGGERQGGPVPEPFLSIQRFFESLSEGQIITLTIITILVILLLVVLFAFLGTIGEIGLIRGGNQADDGAERLSFGELFNGGLPYFWRVFFLNLLIGLSLGLALAVIIFGYAVISVITLGIGAICLLPVICLLIPLAWLIGIYLRVANVALVTDNLSIGAALSRGWEFTRANIGNIILVALVVELLIGVIAGFIIGLPVFLVIAPALAGLIVGTRSAVTGGLAIAGLCLVLYIPVALVLGGILRSYQSVAWVLTYRRLTGRMGAPSVPALNLTAPQ